MGLKKCQILHYWMSLDAQDNMHFMLYLRSRELLCGGLINGRWQPVGQAGVASPVTTGLPVGPVFQVSASGTPHVVFGTGKDALSLEYRRWNGKEWEDPTDPDQKAVLFQKVDVYFGLRVGKDDSVHLAWTHDDQLGQNVYYAHFPGR